MATTQLSKKVFGIHNTVSIGNSYRKLCFAKNNREISLIGYVFISYYG